MLSCATKHEPQEHRRVCYVLWSELTQQRHQLYRAVTGDPIYIRALLYRAQGTRPHRSEVSYHTLSRIPHMLFGVRSTCAC